MKGWPHASQSPRSVGSLTRSMGCPLPWGVDFYFVDAEIRGRGGPNLAFASMFSKPPGVMAALLVENVPNGTTAQFQRVRQGSADFQPAGDCPFLSSVRGAFLRDMRTLEDKMNAMLASIPDAQRALGIGRSTAYRLIDEGKLETVKIGRRTLVRVSSIRALAGEASPTGEA